MSRPDWLIDPAIRLSGHRDDKGRLVAKCDVCRSRKRVGGKQPTAQGIKAMLTYIGRHTHSCQKQPIEIFRLIFDGEQEGFMQFAEMWWVRMLTDQMLKASGVKDQP